MKEFYGNASIIINFDFSGIEADSLEEAMDIVLNAEGIELSLINKTTNKYIDLDVQDWSIPEEVGRGNILESCLSSFSIDEEI